MENPALMPKFDEPMEEFLKSDGYRKPSGEITFSDFQGQEESNYAYWRSLTPAQRLALHTIMVHSIYKDTVMRNSCNRGFEIVFTV